jgi:hypothetical protein
MSPIIKFPFSAVKLSAYIISFAKDISGYIFGQLFYCMVSGLTFIMPPFEEEGVYCFAHVGWSVCRSVHQVVSG